MNSTDIEICRICNAPKEKNHWQRHHQPKERPKHSAILRKLYVEGKIVSWNLGRTKVTDSSVRKQSESLKQHWKEHSHPNKGTRGRKLSFETRKKMSDQRQGRLNANWQGGVTVIKRGIKRSPQYHQWRKAVLTRDDYTCQRCGNKNVKLAHHILPFKEFPLYRFDINNGITLCNDCHKLKHKEMTSHTKY